MKQCEICLRWFYDYAMSDRINTLCKGCAYRALPKLPRSKGINRSGS